MKGAKQERHDNYGQHAERSDLRGTQHRARARMAVPARFQAGQALKMVARAGEEEVVNAVRDMKRQRTSKGGSDRPLGPVLRLVARDRRPLLSVVVSRR